jgi:hypothetical protein
MVRMPLSPVEHREAIAHRIRRDRYAVSHDDVELGVKALRVRYAIIFTRWSPPSASAGPDRHLPDAEDEATLEPLRACAAQTSRTTTYPHNGWPSTGTS